MLGAITIGIEPEIDLGLIKLSWHGLMTAVGLGVGGWLAARMARRQGLIEADTWNAVLVLAFAGIVGSRVLYLAQNDAAALLDPGDWFGTNGFSIYGAVIGGPVAAAVYLRRRPDPRRQLDALAAGFPLGLAVGRVGDLILGEHHGVPTDVAWGIAYSSAAAEVPRVGVPYHSGALYEIVVALVLLVLTRALWRRLRPLALFWAVVGLYALGRFVIFFWRSDGGEEALGVSTAQWISVGLAVVAAAGLVLAQRRASAPPSEHRPIFAGRAVPGR